MRTHTTVAKSVRRVMLLAAGATAFGGFGAYAAEENGDVERIEVTGSRIKRTDMEGATPVSIIDAETMVNEGIFTAADALRKSNFNSFGSFSESSGNSWQSQATVSLRGLGSDRTLVLINGRRIPGSPTTGGSSVNLNTLPMAAVERIEVMTDGGSAVYGSDAVAGVVNIITKKGFEGLTVSGGVGDRQHDDGTNSSEFSILAGMSSDKGNLTVSYERQQRDGIYDKDRDYSAPWATDLNGDGVIDIYNETDGYSYYGATIKNPETGLLEASPDCDNLAANVDGFYGEMGGAAWGPGNAVCAYAYGNISTNKASLDRNTLYVDASYEIAEDVEFFSQAMVSRVDSWGRFAPAAASWSNVPANSTHNPYDEETKGYFRWYQLGNRNSDVTDVSHDLLAGVRGLLDIGDGVDWEVYYHYNKADNKNVGNTYLSYSGLDYNLNNDIPLDSEEGVANMGATTLQEDKLNFNQLYAGASFTLGSLPAGDIGHYFGAEYIEYTYSSQVDAQSEAGLVGGGSGGSSAGERDVTAVFYETVIPVIDTLELNLALRYDDYSDFGDNIAPKASIRWNATDDIVVRASWGQGFRAPALSELFSADSFSAEYATDYVNCQNIGTALDKCSEVQYDTFFKANPNLKAEESTTYNFGVAWDITDWAGIKLDYYNIQVEDAISTISVQDLIWAEFLGQELDIEGVSMTRNSNGTIELVETTYVNGAEFNVEGVDIELDLNHDTEYGEFGFNISSSYIMAYEEEAYYNGPVQDTAGWALQPEWKANATFTYALADHRFSWNINYTGDTFEETAPEFDAEGNPTGTLKPSGHLPSWTIHNATYAYTSDGYGEIRFTVNNVFDRDPVLDSDGKYANNFDYLYNNFGREYRVNYSYSF
ncbi:TonB-dependent receptor [Ferrimonas futtsuensis]|uniref:TonB-dependent receptor n=1 Tax=Ferrimonas futtsuensis TaxID=364764 RepID=UPI0004810036|nr:TonB-dependent receptor [Ferrimonas futtsuensis]